MSITTVKNENITFALCAEPLEQFATWCGGDVVTYEGREVAVTLPMGSPDAAVWPGDVLMVRDGKLRRVQEDLIEGLIPEKVVQLLNKARSVDSEE